MIRRMNKDSVDDPCADPTQELSIKIARRFICDVVVIRSPLVYLDTIISAMPAPPEVNQVLAFWKL